ncbi:NifB/NifX family molybdenum-iron cluster-binding protein [bacterium]|nr:NifB/NifX family molybdenum-iron cluster-binding protein [bacterium]
MQLGLPVHNHRISPVLDTARTLQIYQIEGSKLSGSIKSLDLIHEHPGNRSEFIALTGINVLICGGLSKDLAVRLRKLGVQVIPWIAGRIETIVDAYCHGEFTGEKFTMPGCRDRNRQCGQQRRCRKGHRRNGGQQV